MKKLILIFLFAPVMCFAQRKRDSTGIFPYQAGKIHIIDIVNDSSLSKDELFNNAVVWFAKATNSVNNQIRNKDAFGMKDNIIINNEQDGEFVGRLKGIAHQSLSEILYSFDIYIFVKSGKYKYDLTNFKYLGNSLANAIAGKNMSMDINLESIDKINPKNRNVIIKINENVTNILKDLKESMAILRQKIFKIRIEAIT